MKKKLFLICFLLLSILFAFFIKNSTFAQELTLTPKPSKEATVSPIIKYDLAYPGILPDNRLYKIKVLRDRITAILISDPVKKINFYLLQTDKGILASAMLIDNNKIELAESSALKAEHNFTLISNIFKSSYNFDQYSLSDTKNLVRKLKTASLKHQEVLNSMIKKVPKDKQKTFETVIYFSKTNISEIEKTVKEHEAEKNKKKKY